MAVKIKVNMELTLTGVWQWDVLRFTRYQKSDTAFKEKGCIEGSVNHVG